MLNHSDALAVEMEGAGFARAAYASPELRALVVRSISDLIDGKSASDRAGNQEIAAGNAAAFAFHLLREMGKEKSVDSLSPNVTGEPESAVARNLSDALGSAERLLSLLGHTDLTFDWAVRDTPPKPPSLLLPRRELMARCTATAQPGTWVNIRAPLSRGGSTTAALLTVSLGRRRVEWIRSGKALTRKHLWIQAQLIQGGRQLSVFTNAPDSFARVAQAMGPDSVLVLDDVPDLGSDVVLRDDLVELHVALRRARSQLITVSAQQLPTTVRHLLIEQTFDLEVPSVGQAEIEEAILTSLVDHQADKRALSALIAGVTGGDPSLVSEALRFLALTRSFDSDAFARLATGSVLEHLRAETRARLGTLVPDITDRELLGRLSITSLPFSAEHLDAAAAVEPSITSPRSRLEHLPPQLVTRMQGGYYQVSPLLTGLAETILRKETRAGVHRELAAKYSKERPLTPSSADLAVAHFVAAEAWHDLAGFALALSMAIKTADAAKSLALRKLHFEGFRERMTPKDFFGIRAAQLKLLSIAGEAGEREILSFVEESTHARLDPVTEYIVLSFLGADNPAIHTLTAVDLALRAARVMPRLPADLWAATLPFPPVALMVLPATRARSIDEIDGVFSRLRAMSEAERRALLSGRAQSLSDLLMARVVSIEEAKPVDKRDWKGVLERFGRYATLGQLKGSEHLAVLAGRWRALVTMEHLGDPAAALAELDKRSATNALDRFTIGTTAASILIDAGRLAEAADRLATALSLEVEDSYLTVDALTRLGIVHALQGNWPLSIGALVNVAHLAIGADLLDLRVKAIGELAYAYWKADDRRRAFGSLAGLVVLLDRLARPAYERLWRCTAHALAWYVLMVETGKPPEGAAGREYRPPYPGLFSVNSKELGPVSFSRGYLRLLLSRWALAAGFTAQALSVAGEAESLLSAEGYPALEAGSALITLQSAMRLGDVTQAFRAQARFLSRIPALQAKYAGETGTSPGGIDKADISPVALGVWDIAIPVLANLLTLADGERETVVQEVAERLADELGRHARPDEVTLADALKSDLQVSFVQPDVGEVLRRLNAGALRPEQVALLSLALVRSELDLRDRTAALTQAFCLGVTGAKASRGRHTELAMLVVNYFRVYLMSNRFRLRRPSIFLKRVVDLDTPTMENACGILVAAAEATDYQISAGFLSVLNKHVALGSN